jgi:hypothetical protein
MSKSKIPSPKSIPLSAWLRELERLLPISGADGVTVRELIAAYGHSSRWWREKLRQGRDAGMVKVLTVYRESLIGQRIAVPGFRLLKKGTQRNGRSR